MQSMIEAQPGELGRPETTRRVTRGAWRFLRACGFAVVDEFALPNGRRADLVALGPDGTLRIVEVKSSPADFRTDQKWPDYRDFCDRFYFAISPDLDPQLFPGDAGLIVADAHGGMMLRETADLRLAPARRRVMLVQFGACAAERYAHALGAEVAPS